MVNISLQFHESMVLAAEFFGSQYQNINCLPDNSLKLVIEILFFRSINGAVVLKKWHQTTVKIFVKKLLVAFNTNISNLIFGLEVFACDRLEKNFVLSYSQFSVLEKFG